MNNPQLKAWMPSFLNLIKNVKFKLLSLNDKLYQAWMLKMSFLLASVSMIMLLFWPKFMMSANGSVDHNYLMLVMLANSAGFIHGIGYKPETFIWRVVFTPFFSWPILGHFFITTLNF